MAQDPDKKKINEAEVLVKLEVHNYVYNLHSLKSNWKGEHRIQNRFLLLNKTTI
jgi:hypothetical protein